MRLRPDGKLELDGVADDVGEALLALVKDADRAGGDFAEVWVRNLAAEHIRRMVGGEYWRDDVLVSLFAEKLVTEMSDSELMDFVRLADTPDLI